MVSAVEKIDHANQAGGILNLLGLGVKKRVLFVCPQPVIKRSFERALGDAPRDFQVMYVQDADEALEQLSNHAFSVVMSTDDVSPVDGRIFLEKAMEVSPDTNRIFISGNADVNEVLKVINSAALFQFVVLPWEPIQLRQIVQRACDNFALLHENKSISAVLGDQEKQLTSLAEQLTSTVQSRTTSLLAGLNAALDLRDTETQSHSRRVALYARRLADEFGISENEATEIQRGALLHDIGKIGVSDTILLKPGKLTEEEWVEMRKHAEKGYRILENIPFLGNARHVVHQHHERFDGAGYPQKLSGKDIYVGARIFSIIDTYDAMTSDRPYRKALSHEIAIEEINKCTGTQFDPDLVAAWQRIPKSDLLVLRQKAENDIFAGAI